MRRYIGRCISYVLINQKVSNMTKRDTTLYREHKSGNWTAQDFRKLSNEELENKLAELRLTLMRLQGTLEPPELGYKQHAGNKLSINRRPPARAALSNYILRE